MRLIDAVINNDKQKIIDFLALKDPSRSVEEVDEMGRSPLHWAAALGYNHLINALIEAGAEVNKTDHSGATPVFLAAEMGHAKIITALRKKGADVNLPNKSGEYPLHSASKHRRITAILALLEDLDREDIAEIAKNQKEFEIKAQSESKSETIKAHKKIGEKAVVNQEDFSGETAVYYAVRSGGISALNALIRAGGLVNIIVNGNTVIHEAALHGHYMLISLLKDAGADVEKEDKLGRTPLYLAAQNGDKQTCMALLNSGANVEITLKYAKSQHSKIDPIIKLLEEVKLAYSLRLNRATPNNNKPIPKVIEYHLDSVIFSDQFIQVLNILRPMSKIDVDDFTARLDSGIKTYGPNFVNNTDKVGNGNFLYWAAFHGRTDLIRILLKRGADLKAAINCAEKKQEFRILDLLSSTKPVYFEIKDRIKDISEKEFANYLTLGIQQHGGDFVNCKDQDFGGTCLYWAAFYGRTELIPFITGKNAQVNEPDKNGATPAFIAAEKGFHDAIIILHVVGADINKPNKDGVTPLFIAAKNGHLETVQSLLISGANASDDNILKYILEIQGQEDLAQMYQLLTTHLRQYPYGISSMHPPKPHRNLLSKPASSEEQKKEQSDPVLTSSGSTSQLKKESISPTNRNTFHQPAPLTPPSDSVCSGTPNNGNSKR